MRAVEGIVEEVFFAVDSIALMAALVGGRALPGFVWLLFPTSDEPSVAVLEGCHSPAFGVGPPGVEDISVFVRFADFVR